MNGKVPASVSSGISQVGVNIINKPNPQLPCNTCKGFCCGPVPVTATELKTIKQKLRTMPVNRKRELQQQTRFHGTCIFFDLDTNRCGIYTARPEVCRKFGHHKNLPCPFEPGAATKEEWQPREKPVGLLSVDYTWKNFA